MLALKRNLLIEFHRSACPRVEQGQRPRSPADYCALSRWHNIAGRALNCRSRPDNGLDVQKDSSRGREIGSAACASAA